MGGKLNGKKWKKTEKRERRGNMGKGKRRRKAEVRRNYPSLRPPIFPENEEKVRRGSRFPFLLLFFFLRKSPPPPQESRSTARSLSKCRRLPPIPRFFFSLKKQYFRCAEVRRVQDLVGSVVAVVVVVASKISKYTLHCSTHQ